MLPGESNREIADSFMEYLNNNDLLQTQLKWERSDLAIHFKELRRQRRCQGLKTISFSKTLFALARRGNQKLQVWNGVTVVFRGPDGFKNRSSLNVISRNVSRQFECLRKFESDYIDITPVGEQTSLSKPGHFKRKLTTMSTEFAVIELEITNTSTSDILLEGCKLFPQNDEFSIESPENMALTPLSKIKLSVQSLQEAEVCSTEIATTIAVDHASKECILSHLEYEVVDANNLSTSDSEEQVTAQRGTRVSFDNFIEGEKPDMLYENKLKMKWPLPPCKIPYELKVAIKRGALGANRNERTFDRFKSDVLLRKSLEQKLDSNNYSKKFERLLHIEELKNEEDIKRYDMEGATLTRRGSLLYLKVPGLAEKRPSVLRGDRVYVKPLNSHCQPEGDSYEGYVHHVEQEEVGLGFNSRLLEAHIRNKKYYVRFVFNRLALRLMHRSTTNVISRVDKEEILFPEDSPSHMESRSFPLYNRLIEENLEQRKAVEHIVTGKTAQVYIIYGPPGTGKTITMVEIIHQLLRKKTSSHMLVCAPSNSACDLLTSRLLEHADKREIVRMHAASRNWKEVPEEVKEVSNHQGEFRFPSKEELMKCRIIVTTLVTAGRLASAMFPNGHFDHVFVDEAGQAMEPEAMIAVAGILSDHGKIVLAGDPKQLGPIIRSPIANRHGLELSYLERLMNSSSIYQKDGGRYNRQCITKLLKNYRSHPSIIDVSNKEFYDGELQICANEMQRNYLTGWEGLPNGNFPVLFHGILGEDKQESNSPSFFNQQEVNQVKKYIDQLLDIKGKKMKPSDIGVITPYRKQVEKIKKVLTDKKDIKVGSVEEFQGQERRVIIISTVRSNENHLQFDAKFNLGFLRNPKRFNVAVTRAKALLVIVGNPKLLSLDKYWGLMLKHCIINRGYTGIPFNENKMISDRLPCLTQALTLSDGEDEGGDFEDQINPHWRQDP